MPIESVEPPAAALEAVRSGLRSLFEAGATGNLEIATAEPGSLTFDAPLQVFVLQADDLVAGRGLAAARRVAWRYVVRDRGRAVATADAATVRPGSHAFSHLDAGAFVGPTAAAVEEAGTLPETRDGAFEARMLEIPALHSTSLWLHSRGEGHDVIAPLAPSPPPLKAGRPYPVEAFLRIVEPKAAEIGEDEGLHGGSGS